MGTEVPLKRWNRAQWLTMAAGILESDSWCASRERVLGAAFCREYQRLPAWPYPTLGEKVLEAQGTAVFVAKNITLDRLQGTVWLFDPPDTWPDGLDHWTRVACLLRSAYTVEARRVIWNPRAVERWPPLELREDGGGMLWMDDGCRRAYTAWLIGADTVPSVVMTRNGQSGRRL